MALRITEPPAEEPVSLPDAKTHLRIEPDDVDEDAYLTALIAAARGYGEDFTRRRFVTQAWSLTLDGFPRGNQIVLPGPPLRSVASVKYFDTTGVEATFQAADYIVDADSEPGRIVLAYARRWPAVVLRPANGVVVTFEAGYGNALAVPKGIKQAILLLVGHWYENREPVVTGTIVSPIPVTVDALLWQHRVPTVY